MAFSYGPLICIGTYLVQRHAVSNQVLMLSSLLGILIGLFLLINEFPDFNADRLAVKRTLVVRLGRRQASLLFAWILVATFGVVMILPLFDHSYITWLGLIAAFPAYSAASRLRRFPETTSQIVPAQAATLLCFLLFALGTGIGLLLY